MLLATHLSTSFLNSGFDFPLHLVQFLLSLLSASAMNTWGMSTNTSQKNSTMSVSGPSHQMFLKAAHSRLAAAKWIAIHVPMKSRRLKIETGIQNLLHPLMSFEWRLYMMMFQILPNMKLMKRQKIALCHLELTQATPYSQQTMMRSMSERPV